VSVDEVAHEPPVEGFVWGYKGGIGSILCQGVHFGGSTEEADGVVDFCHRKDEEGIMYMHGIENVVGCGKRERKVEDVQGQKRKMRQREKKNGWCF
jgi:uncharacterized protein (DUF362 family)